MLADLADLDRDLLVVLALGPEEGLHEGQWLRRADRAALFAHTAKRYDDADIERLAATLLARGALIRGENGALFVDEPWLAPLLADAAARAILTPLSERLAEPGPIRAVKTLGRLGDARLALALGQHELFDFVVKRSLWSRSEPETDPIWVRVLGLHPSEEWLETLGPRYRSYYLRGALDRAFLQLRAPADAVLAAARVAAHEPDIAARLALVLAARGQPAEASSLSAGRPYQLHYAHAFAALVSGDIDRARAEFAPNPRAARALPVMAPFAALVGLTAPDSDVAIHVATLEKLTRKPSPWPFALAALSDFALLRSGREPTRTREAPRGTWIDYLIVALVARYCAAPTPVDLGPIATRASRNGFDWVARQVRHLQDAAPAAGSLASLFDRREPWELALEALRPQERTESADEGDGELVWEVRASSWDDSLGVTARWVKTGNRRGKEISLARFESGELAPADARDRVIVAALIAAKSRRTRLGRRQLSLFVGHPRVISSSGLPIRVEERAARLLVSQSTTEAVIALDPPGFDETGAVVLEAPDVLTLVQKTPETERIARILGGASLRVPARGLPRLGSLLEALGPHVVVHTEGALKRDEEAGDARVHVQLTRCVSDDTLDGLVVRFRVVPRPGVELLVGEPPEVLVAPSGSTLGSVRRNLAGERRALEAVHERCPSLATFERDGDELRADLETALTFLGELAELAESDAFPRVVVTWRSKPLRTVRSARGDTKVRFALRSNTRWLEVDGEVRLADGRLVPMQRLLAAMEHARGRFVPLEAGEFLELEASFQHALENLLQVKRLGVRSNLPLALAPAVLQWTRGFETSCDATVTKRTELTGDVEVPATLQATLRDYQREGFEFLARRAAAGAGSILADDMGLGKTVQTLALLLERGAQGPALVVAPTSVLHNWTHEIGKFAPSLRVMKMTELESAGAHTIVLTSYGLLSQHAERLAARPWSTLVFDEAHALKNPATLRWKAARTLTADAIVALTGTPVENHVGELHALLDVVEPGMLGSRTTFRRMFAVPMARGEERAATMLRRIVRPSILRRSKAEVLTELPPKTDMVRLVSASSDHRAFYEAVRLRATARAEEVRRAQHPSGKARIELLAEITRLRRAAIDPRLVGGPTAPHGSKLETLVHVVRELREEGHRALVFSQFLEVLDFARERLEADQVSTLRLDGTMTPKARAQVIDAFQRGEADVLLASLKAGGVGVNLTAADFVIHLDPWWNPAVEDQATDRTHRLGQTRAVTVLRLCTEQTIEEKVLALHGDKRRLYEDVISQADGVPAPFGPEIELHAALRELLG